MADNALTQTLGFDCADALAALEAMDKGMAALTDRFNSMASAMRDWNSAAVPVADTLSKIGKSAGSAASAMERLNTAMSKQPASAGAPPTIPPPPTPPNPQPWGQAANHAKSFTISLQMLSRIVITQAIVRAISGIRDALSEALTSNIEFVKRISELNSILDSPTEGLTRLSAGAARLSQEFNFPLGQVVEAEYQAVSAQFTSTAQRTDILSASLKLAKVGVMDLNTATNLITGTLNAYGMSSGEADTIAGKFFQTIKDGRVRGDELASSLGKVMPVAAELGVSINEVTTAIVQLTVAGVKAPEASTSLRSALMALIKPSADLRKELRNLGYDSGEQIIAAYGLVGALNMLRDSTDGSIASAVKFIPNVRAQNTVLRETKDHMHDAVVELEKMKAAGADSLNKAFKIFIDTNAEKVTADLNKLKVWLTTDLGKTLLDAVANVLKLTGGIGTLSSAISGCAAPVTALVAAMTAYGFGLRLTASLARDGAAADAAKAAAANGLAAAETRVAVAQGLRTKTATALQGLLSGGMAVATVGLSIWGTLETGLRAAEASIEQARQEYFKKVDEIVAKNDAARRAIHAAEDEDNARIVSGAMRVSAEINRLYTSQLDAAKDENHEFLTATKGAMEQLVSAKEKGVHLLRDLAKESEKAIQDSLKRSHQIAEDEKNRLFEAYVNAKPGSKEQLYYRDYANRQINNDSDKALSLGEKANDISAEAKEKSRNAKSPEQMAEVEAEFKKAEAMALQSLAVAKTTGLTNDLRWAEETVSQVVADRLAAEEQIRKLKEDQIRAANEAAAKEQENATEMRNLLKKVAEETNLYDKKGIPLDKQTREKNLAQAREDMDRFQELAFSKGNWDISQFLNFDAFRKKMLDVRAEAASQSQTEDLKNAPEHWQKLNEKINGSEQIKGMYQGLSNKPLNPENTAAEDMAEVTKNYEDARKAAEHYKATLDDITKAEAEARNVRDDIASTARIAHSTAEKAYYAANTGTQFAGDKTNFEKYEELQKVIQTYSEHPENLRTENFERLAARIEEIKPKLMHDDSSRLDHNMEQLHHIVELKEEADKKMREASTGEGEEQQDYLNQLPAKAGETRKSLEEMKSHMEGFKLKAAEAVAPLDDIDERLRTAADRARTLKAALADVNAGVPGATERYANLVAQPANPTGHAQGGGIYLAGGGYPRGTDQHLAMLSEGEFVVNAKSARKFSSQLTAMNAGANPSYHTHGGSVTNVGDINVTVHGDGVAHNTGRSIAQAVRRELRRGSSTLS